MTQSQVLSILKTGANVFLTGEPGSGKTYVINEYAAYLRSHGIEPAITASAGIAATHIGGMTIHSWSGIGIKTKLDKQSLNKITTSQYIIKRVRRAKVLIIEEVSMLTGETLSMADTVCREIKQNPKPFGGMQVIFAGDFFQLPPVMRRENEEDIQTMLIEKSSARFAYDSPAWSTANPFVCYLSEQYRQDDKNFLAILAAIRNNTFNAGHLNHLRTRKFERDLVPEKIPKLFSHNTDVDNLNSKVLGSLSGDLHTFPMTSYGPNALVAALKKGCLSPETLNLKVGAAVMFTKNNPKEGFVNGTLGSVEGFSKERGGPIVKTRNGRKIKVEPMDWTVEENCYVRAQISQLPLRLAWAITVHKSQGMNLDAAEIDLSKCFVEGMGYVALSRLRTLSGLKLKGINDMAFYISKDAFDADKKLKKESKILEIKLKKIPIEKIKKRQEQFLVGIA